MRDDIEANDGVPYRKRQWVLDQLGDEADEFETLLADPNISPRAIQRALTRRGIRLGVRTIYFWAGEARG